MKRFCILALLLLFGQVMPFAQFHCCLYSTFRSHFASECEQFVAACARIRFVYRIFDLAHGAMSLSLFKIPKMNLRHLRMKNAPDSPFSILLAPCSPPLP